MKKNLILAAMLISGAMGASAGTYDYKTFGNDPMKTRLYTLDNGLKVFMTANTERPRVQAYIAVKTGSRNDPAETTGLAHYLEHLMFKGTDKFGTTDAAAEKPYLDAIEALYEQYRKLTDPQQRKECYSRIDSLSQLAAAYFIPNEYDKLMSSIGAIGCNAFTSTDVTCYTEDVPSNELENYLKIQSDRFRNMVIRGFHTELEAVYEEKNMSLANDMSKAYDALTALLYPTHPYGTQTTLGTQQHLKNPSIANIKKYFSRYYVPNNVAICLAGDLDFDATIALVDKYFGSWKRSDSLRRPEFAPLKPLNAPKDTTVYGKEAETLFMGWTMKGAADLQCDTLELLENMLVNGTAGLLETSLEQTMKLQGVSAMLLDNADYSAFCIMAVPNAGQTLESLRALIDGEIARYRRGEFDAAMIKSTLDNMKLDYYRNLRSNNSRASDLAMAFVNNRDWAVEVGKFDRLAGVTKQQLVDFINSRLTPNYVCVYKKTGDDTSLQKIDKPAITPIPANRDLSSEFLRDIQNSEVEPIHPQFVDFKRDLVVGEFRSDIPLLYKQVEGEQLFELRLRYEFGTENVKGLAIAADLLDYIGTRKKTVGQVKLDFYNIACDYEIYVENDYMDIVLEGLSENMPEALALLEDFLNNAYADKESYSSFVDIVEKERADEKSSQGSCFARLNSYGSYGPYNGYLNTYTTAELRALDPKVLTGMFAQFDELPHKIMYSGPLSHDRLTAVLAKTHKTAKKLKPIPEGRRYMPLATEASDVMIAPYDAKNIYVMLVNCSGKQWNPEEAAIVELFNEYMGSGMNSIVFQEIREARGLAYQAVSSYLVPSWPGKPERFYALAITQNDKMADCIDVFKSIIDNVPQSEGAFNIAKQSLMKKLQSRRTTRFGVLEEYCDSERKGISSSNAEMIYRQLQSVTLQDVIEFARKNVSNRNYRYLILGNEKELDMDYLRKVGEIKRVSLEDIFGY